MNFQIVSDIHIERDNNYHINIIKSAENIIIAGDLGNIEDFQKYTNFLISICRIYSNVFLVPGNNEFYTNNYYSYCFLNTKLNEFCKTIPNLFYLNGRCIEFKGIRIYGDIFWSNIPEKNKNEHFLPIRENNGNYINSDWINTKHKLSLNNLMNHLGSQDNRKLLVITHYPPTFENTMTSKHLLSKKRFFYANHLDYLLKKDNVHTWIYAHTHINSDFITKEGTRIVSNQYRGKGYVNNKVITI
jgi:predicted phosphodiesterase